MNAELMFIHHVYLFSIKISYSEWNFFSQVDRQIKEWTSESMDWQWIIFSACFNMVMMGIMVAYWVKVLTHRSVLCSRLGCSFHDNVSNSYWRGSIILYLGCIVGEKRNSFVILCPLYCCFIGYFARKLANNIVLVCLLFPSHSFLASCRILGQGLNLTVIEFNIASTPLCVGIQLVVFSSVHMKNGV